MHAVYKEKWDALLQSLASLDPSAEDYIAALEEMEKDLTEMAAAIHHRKVAYINDRE